jgi:hypothetical protein
MTNIISVGIVLMIGFILHQKPISYEECPNCLKCINTCEREFVRETNACKALKEDFKVNKCIRDHIWAKKECNERCPCGDGFCN